MDSAAEVLRKFWGYKSFREGQAEIVSAVLDRQNVLAVMPTGAGKSVCYQVPGLLTDGFTLVISPLVSLIKDQVSDLILRNIPAVGLYSGLGNREIDLILNEALKGKYKFLFVSPERLHTEIFEVRSKSMDLNLIVIDEAHCISSWGHDFRPAYREIAPFIAGLKRVPVLALTATATPEVRKDIVNTLELSNPKIFVQSFTRANLSFSVFNCETKTERMAQIVSRVPGSAIVYARTRKQVEDLADFLVREGQSATAYHAGLSISERSLRQEAWFKNQTRIMVATNAFGMGINKTDVSLVVHVEVPDSPEAYYQEAGRAGRDGKKAYAVALFTANDLNSAAQRVDLTYPNAELLGRVYQCLANFFGVAIGSNNLSSYNFEFGRFCHTYNLAPGETWLALKRLETEGLISLTDGGILPSRVLITTNKAELYSFQVANAALDPLIKILQRQFGASVFSQYCTIQENKIAALLNMRVIDLERQLKQLQRSNIIDYQAWTEKPQLAFTLPRQDPNHLPIDYASLAIRKKSDLQRADAMKTYLSNTRICRSVQLAAWFGQTDAPNCQICDVCLKNAKAGIANTDSLETRLLGMLISPKTSRELLSDWSVAAQAEGMNELRKMLANGLIEKTPEGKLKRKD